MVIDGYWLHPNRRWRPRLRFPITALLLFRIQLLPNLFGDIVLRLKLIAVSNVLDRTAQVMGVQFVMLFAIGIPPAMRTQLTW